MKFRLSLRKPVPRLVGTIDILLAENGNVTAWDGDMITFTMTSVRVDCIAADGILLCGMEPKGSDRDGAPVYRNQEWWLMPVHSADWERG